MTGLGIGAGFQMGDVTVVTTSGRDLNAEEITGLFMAKLLYVGDNAPPAIRDQAQAFKDRIRALALGYIEQAQKSATATAITKLELAGMTDAARLLRGN